MAFTEGTSVSNLNGATAVDVVAAPAASTRRLIRTLTICNIDTASVTVTVQYNDNGTIYPMFVRTLAVNETLAIGMRMVAVLDATTRKLQAKLSGAPATTNPTCTAAWADAS
jgi:hypothetical protein